MSVEEAPLYFRVNRREADHIISDLLAAAHTVRDSDPARAEFGTALAHRLQRHVFAVRPLVYKPGPVDVVIESPNVTAFVGQYGTGDAA